MPTKPAISHRDGRESGTKVGGEGSLRRDEEMLHTGVVRHLDDLGRVVIPMELRRTLGFGIRQPVTVLVDGDDVVLRRYADACVLCGSTDTEFEQVRGRSVCTDCTAQVRALDL